jgi:acetyl-CoA acyltransferase
VVVDAVRTPVGRRGGGLAGVHPVDLSAHVLEALAARTGLDPAVVDDVVWGCVSQTGEQAVNVARNAVLAAGWPEDVVGMTVDRQCGSSQQAVHVAAAGVVAGHYDVAVAGGVESMSRVPMLCTITQGPGLPFGPRMSSRYDDGLVPQGVSAEIVAERWGLSRTDVDEIAVRSHARAAAATDSGAVGPELAPVAGVSADEGIRRGTDLATLAGLRTVFRDDGVVTAGNSSQISDGAAALLVTTSEVAARHGWRPLARVHAVARAGVDPVTMLTAPIEATARVLARAGLRLDEIDAFEVNEAFASVVGAWLAETGADPERVNPRGGAIALGHPLGDPAPA